MEEQIDEQINICLKLEGVRDEPLLVIRYDNGKIFRLWLFIYGPALLFFGFCLKRSIEDSTWVLTAMALMFVFGFSIVFLVQSNIKETIIYEDRITVHYRFLSKFCTVYWHDATYNARSQLLSNWILFTNVGKPRAVVVYPGLMHLEDKILLYELLTRLSGKEIEQFKYAWEKKFIE